MFLYYIELLLYLFITVFIDFFSWWSIIVFTLLLSWGLWPKVLKLLNVLLFYILSYEANDHFLSLFSFEISNDFDNQISYFFNVCKRGDILKILFPFYFDTVIKLCLWSFGGEHCSDLIVVFFSFAFYLFKGILLITNTHSLLKELDKISSFLVWYCLKFILLTGGDVF